VISIGHTQPDYVAKIKAQLIIWVLLKCDSEILANRTSWQTRKTSGYTDYGLFYAALSGG
jgi:hypothetical protein